MLKKLFDKPKNTQTNLKAFTLAEILITVGIIGVIAAMTIPSLIHDYQEKQTVTQLKKVYSTLQSAYKMAVQENGDPTNWDIVGLNSSTGSQNILNILAPYLNIMKNCGSEVGCFYNGAYKKLMGGNWGTSLEVAYTSSLGLNKIMLSDGTSIYIQARSADCTEGSGTNASLPTQSICALIGVDINGPKSPNQWGYDLFSFQLTKYNILPRGSEADIGTVFPTNCNITSSIGWGCAAWVIYNENTDYLQCSDLAWNGKTKCD